MFPLREFLLKAVMHGKKQEKKRKTAFNREPLFPMDLRVHFLDSLWVLKGLLQNSLWIAYGFHIGCIWIAYWHVRAPLRQPRAAPPSLCVLCVLTSGGALPLLQVPGLQVCSRAQRGSHPMPTRHAHCSRVSLHCVLAITKRCQMPHQTISRASPRATPRPRASPLAAWVPRTRPWRPRASIKIQSRRNHW